MKCKFNSSHQYAMYIANTIDRKTVILSVKTKARLSNLFKCTVADFFFVVF